MLTTVPTGKGGINGYGLGIYEIKLPNDISIWGHTGGIPGFDTFTGGTHGGRHMLTVNLNSMGRAESPGLLKVFYLLNLASKNTDGIVIYVMFVIKQIRDEIDHLSKEAFFLWKINYLRC